MAYQLSFPIHSKLHPIFHVSCLKKVIGTKCHTETSLPKLNEEGSIWLHPKEVLDQHKCRLFYCTIKEVVLQWKDTTWEPTTILNSFLISSLEDKAILQRGGHVRDLTSLTPHVVRIIYLHLIKG